MTLARQYFTPVQIAKLLHVAPRKVLGWIQSDELRAEDVAEGPGARPCWRISSDDVAEFLQRRQSRPVLPSPRRCRTEVPRYV